MTVTESIQMGLMLSDGTVLNDGNRWKPVQLRDLFHLESGVLKTPLKTPSQSVDSIRSYVVDSGVPKTFVFGTLVETLSV